MINIASGITCLGRKSLNDAKKIVDENKWNITYGDTDSLYISAPDAKFREVDIDYYTEKISKLEYCTKLVNMTFVFIAEIRDLVNAWFLKEDGTRHRNMAYEELLYPSVWLAKKKYFGVEHQNAANFDYKDLFVRGLEVKKRGVSQFLVKVCEEIMNKSMSVSNTSSLMELVKFTIIQTYKDDKKWTIKDFTVNGNYRSAKKNVKNNVFVKRMLDENNIIIRSGEQFKFIVAKKYPWKYDIRGRKKILSIGDKMELYNDSDDVSDNDRLFPGVEVDIDYYMDKTIVGQLARFVSYHDMFHVEQKFEGEDYKIADQKCVKLASDYVRNLCKPHYKKYTENGRIHKAVFRSASKIVSEGYSRSKYIPNDTIKLLQIDWSEMKDIECWLHNKAMVSVRGGLRDTKVKQHRICLINPLDIYERIIRQENDNCDNSVKIIKKKDIDSKLINLFLGNSGILAKREEIYKKRYAEINADCRSKLSSFTQINKVQNNLIKYITDIIKKNVELEKFLKSSNNDNIKLVEEKIQSINDIQSNNCIDGGDIDGGNIDNIVEITLKQDTYKKLVQDIKSLYSRHKINEMFRYKNDLIYKQLTHSVQKSNNEFTPCDKQLRDIAKSMAMSL
jgi:hypothetical protein